MPDTTPPEIETPPEVETLPAPTGGNIDKAIQKIQHKSANDMKSMRAEIAELRDLLSKKEPEIDPDDIATRGDLLSQRETLRDEVRSAMSEQQQRKDAEDEYWETFDDQYADHKGKGQSMWTAVKRQVKKDFGMSPDDSGFDGAARVLWKQKLDGLKPKEDKGTPDVSADGAKFTDKGASVTTPVEDTQGDDALIDMEYYKRIEAEMRG